ncbi:8-oxo-dGTP diphosphatase [Frankia sp. EI5c]|uniref:(deoxy)nucleoside triphosphate pyrophosphohydrolase n=1 Tax=Frankia sp. EI5c TaxID=683316 RepID=UPI0007C3B181|nr:(deoxy)nucleoside triphosphate pyrophosphohydrolase [Frankia sp. EI5c]OAA24192.1 8-oxo-dGTP diphosphatase [Frankia sp. EI5c]
MSPMGQRPVAEPPVEENRLVVAVALVDGARRVLAASRLAPPALAGLWEFPGGKVEPGEDELTALHRECREELRVEIELGRLFGEIALPRPGWRMRLWLGRVSRGVPVAVEHGELRWLGVNELDDVPWLPADLPLVDALRRELAAPPEGELTPRPS